jgi:cytochrome c-type biogenesis protein
VSDGVLAYAFAAGIFAAVNPCGFAMLPAYIAWFVGLHGDPADEGSVDSTLSRALLVGGVVSAGFLAVFGVTGLLLHAGLRVLIDTIPWIALGVGVVMVVLGFAVLRGYQFSLTLGRKAPSRRNLRSMFTFGVSYALASLSCTLPVFLSVVVGSLATTSLIGGVATLGVYGLAMSLSLLGITLAVALARHGTVRRLRQISRYVNPAAGVLLILAGAYITWFWALNLRSGADATGAAGRFVESLSQRAVQFTGDHWPVIAVALTLAVLATVLRLLLREPERGPMSSGDEVRPPDGEDPGRQASHHGQGEPSDRGAGA